MKNSNRYSVNISLIALGFLLTLSAYPFTSVWGGSSTPTPTITPGATSPTPMPTPNTELIRKVNELTAGDEDCKLPCLWGIQPGKTTVEELLQFIAQNFDEDLYTPDSGRGRVPFYEMDLFLNPGLFQSVYRIDHNLVSKIDLRLTHSENWLYPNVFALSEVLKSMGTPTDVYMRIIPSPPLSYSLALIYKDKGVMVEYVVFPSDISSDEPISICPYLDETTNLVEVWLQSTENPETISDNLAPSLADTSTYGPYWTLKQMTDLSIDDFTETLTSAFGTCVYAKSPNELGKENYPF